VGKTKGKGTWLAVVAGLTLAMGAARAADGAPALWPDYLKDFKLPAGRTWDQYRVRAKDAMPQALIPAGEFLMGSPDGHGQADERPQKRIYVSSFWMDVHDVTVAQYRAFCQATGRPMPEQPARTEALHPMVAVSRDEAAAYAAWAGAVLPSEAQWERAARGGLEARQYPWGDAWDNTLANSVDTGLGRTTPVASYAPNGFGLYDMVGNVWQWCRDNYAENWYAAMPERDPENTAPSPTRVLRGGGWVSGPWYLRVACRIFGTPGLRLDYLGFRCAQAP
jgi:formylglycine-generating enzyme required for sulfatase activity